MLGDKLFKYNIYNIIISQWEMHAKNIIFSELCITELETQLMYFKN